MVFLPSTLTDRPPNSWSRAYGAFLMPQVSKAVHLPREIHAFVSFVVHHHFQSGRTGSAFWSWLKRRWWLKPRSCNCSCTSAPWWGMLWRKESHCNDVHVISCAQPHLCRTWAGDLKCRIGVEYPVELPCAQVLPVELLSVVAFLTVYTSERLIEGAIRALDACLHCGS